MTYDIDAYQMSACKFFNVVCTQSGLFRHRHFIHQALSSLRVAYAARDCTAKACCTVFEIFEMKANVCLLVRQYHIVVELCIHERRVFDNR